MLQSFFCFVVTAAFVNTLLFASSFTRSPSLRSAVPPAKTMAPAAPRISFIPHGGGPMPLLGDPSHAEVVKYMKKLGRTMFGGADAPKPSAVIVVTAHHETPQPVICLPTAKLLYDYYGFPPETYQYKYTPPAPSDAIVQKLTASLRAAGFEPSIDRARGLDHGVFVPMLLMNPEQDIPVMSLSVLNGLDPKRHFELGKALTGLTSKDHVAVVGSGLSFHNMGAFFGGGGGKSGAWSRDFHQDLVAALTSPDHTPAQRLDALAKWSQFREARRCHPREEHLIPLMVCEGAAEGSPGRIDYQGELLNHEVVAVTWP